MNTPLDDRLDKATDSAFGRFLYKVILPVVLTITGFLVVRAINGLDESVSELKTSNNGQALVQSRIQADVQAIRSQMDYQTQYQALVDQQQNEKIDRHDRVLNLK